MHSVLTMEVPYSAVGARSWIMALVANRMEWHLDDDPEEIINGRSGDMLFSTEIEHDAVRTRVAACFALLDDPHETMWLATRLRDGESLTDEL